MKLFSKIYYHGSPHVFDKFDLDKIGTGEGAQVHGWGLYFSENKDVAEEYRNVLTFKRGMVPDYYELTLYDKYKFNNSTVEGVEELAKYLKNKLDINVSDDVMYEIADEMFIGYHTLEDLIVGILSVSIINEIEMDKNENEIEMDKNKVEQFVKESNPKLKLIGLGSLITIELDDNAVLIPEKDFEWTSSNKLSKRLFNEIGVSTYLQMKDNLLNKLKNKYPDVPENVLDTTIIYAKRSMRQAKTVLEEYSQDEKLNDKILHDIEIDPIMIIINSWDLYDYLTNKYGSSKEASLWLSDRGVDGISYTGGIDGNCIVLWNLNKCKIKEKEGGK